jgi:hypothetical protein
MIMEDSMKVHVLYHELEIWEDIVLLSSRYDNGRSHESPYFNS